MSAMTPSATPTPIPADAPVDRPEIPLDDDSCGVGVSVPVCDEPAAVVVASAEVVAGPPVAAAVPVEEVELC
jgi:hypothetical protein